MNQEKEFITRCPSCRTSFRVTPEQMYTAGGAVRCGACLRIFQADEQLVLEGKEQLPDAGDQEEPAHGQEVLLEDSFEETSPEESASAEPVPEEAGEFLLVDAGRAKPASDSINRQEIENNYWQDWEEYLSIVFTSSECSQGLSPNLRSVPDLTGENKIPDADEPESEEVCNEEDTTEEPEPVLAGNIFGLALSDEHETLVGELTPEKSTLAFWYAAAIFLVVVGALQYTWFNKHIYAQQTEYRSYFLLACSRIGCDLPEYKNVQELVAKNLLIRSHPRIENALVVDSILENSADFRQEFPDLWLSFRNIENVPIAARRFSPADYLAGELRGLRYIPANTEVRFSIEILDPGESAFGYSLEVLPRG